MYTVAFVLFGKKEGFEIFDDLGWSNKLPELDFDLFRQKVQLRLEDINLPNDSELISCSKLIIEKNLYLFFSKYSYAKDYVMRDGYYANCIILKNCYVDTGRILKHLDMVNFDFKKKYIKRNYQIINENRYILNSKYIESIESSLFSIPNRIIKKESNERIERAFVEIDMEKPAKSFQLFFDTAVFAEYFHKFDPLYTSENRDIFKHFRTNHIRFIPKSDLIQFSRGLAEKIKSIKKGNIEDTDAYKISQLESAIEQKDAELEIERQKNQDLIIHLENKDKEILTLKKELEKKETEIDGDGPEEKFEKSQKLIETTKSTEKNKKNKSKSNSESEKERVTDTKDKKAFWLKSIKLPPKLLSILKNFLNHFSFKIKLPSTIIVILLIGAIYAFLVHYMGRYVLRFFYNLFSN